MNHPTNYKSWLALALVAALGTTGCTHVSQRSKTSTAHIRSLPPEIVAEYSYPKGLPFDAQVEPGDETDQYAVKRVKLLAVPDGTNTTRRVTVDYYDVHGDAKAPVVLVLPMAGGGYSIERHFANYFASRGYAAVIVHRDRVPKNEQLIERLNPMMHRMVLDHKRVIDWLETVPDVDTSKLGIFGISLGGIKGAILTPLEPRIRAAMIGLAGGDVPYILLHSTEPGLAKRREEYLKEHNLTVEVAEAKLREMITRDPLVYAPYVDPQKVLMVIARFDTVVPTEKGLLLKEKMGNPETIMLPSGHISAALSIPYIKSQSFDFFEKRFNAPPAEQTIASRKRNGNSAAR